MSKRKSLRTYYRKTKSQLERIFRAAGFNTRQPRIKKRITFTARELTRVIGKSETSKGILYQLKLAVARISRFVERQNQKRSK